MRNILISSFITAAFASTASAQMTPATLRLSAAMLRVLASYTQNKE